MSRAMLVTVGSSSRNSSSRFGAISTPKLVTPVTLPPGRLRLATSPTATGSVATLNTIGDRCGRRLGRECGRRRTGRDHGHLTTNQVGRQCRQPVILILGEAIFKRDVLTLDKACFSQAMTDGGHEVWIVAGRPGTEEPDQRHRRLLRPCRKRPRRRATEQRDELAPSHSITSSAVASSVGGTSRPSAVAVLRLITSSYLVGACTGRSAGFSPFSMRSTY